MMSEVAIDHVIFVGGDSGPVHLLVLFLIKKAIDLSANLVMFPAEGDWITWIAQSLSIDHSSTPGTIENHRNRLHERNVYALEDYGMGSRS
jgi:hypothetical protein